MSDDLGRIPGPLPLQMGSRHDGDQFAYLVIAGRMIPRCRDCGGAHVPGFTVNDTIQVLTQMGERIELAHTNRAPYEDFYDGVHWEAYDGNGDMHYWREKKDVEAMQ